MVSGYDKKPPDPKYNPDLGPSGNLFLIALVAVVLAASLGWLFV